MFRREDVLFLSFCRCFNSIERGVSFMGVECIFLFKEATGHGGSDVGTEEGVAAYARKGLLARAHSRSGGDFPRPKESIWEGNALGA